MLNYWKNLCGVRWYSARGESGFGSWQSQGLRRGWAFWWIPSAMKACLICSKDSVECSWSWRLFCHLPPSCSKPNLCRLWTMCKDLLLLLIYIIPLNIFLSHSRGVTGTLVKEKEEIPSLKSFQHRRQTAISRAEKKKKSHLREGRGGLC